MGHSGCGKSTLLKIICGLVDYEDGQVERNGHPVTGRTKMWNGVSGSSPASVAENKKIM